MQQLADRVSSRNYILKPTLENVNKQQASVDLEREEKKKLFKNMVGNEVLEIWPAWLNFVLCCVCLFSLPLSHPVLIVTEGGKNTQNLDC